MVTITYTDGRIERREYAIVSGDAPIGSQRHVQDGSTVHFLPGCLEITEEGTDERLISRSWPWSKISEVKLGPVTGETTLLREDEDGIPF